MSTMRIITKDEIGRQAMTQVKTHPGRVLLTAPIIAVAMTGLTS